MSELTGAKISRGILRGKAEKKIHLLKEAFVRLQRIDTEQVTIEGTTELQAALDRTREALEKYTAAIVRCQTLQGEEHDPKDEHLVVQEEFEDNLDNLDYKIQALKARVKEEKSTRARAEANANGRAHDQPGNTGRLTAKPPPQLPKDVSLEEFDTWTHTWNDYFAVTKLEKEPHSMQRANLMSHMSQEMRSVVEHILGIGDDTTQSCLDIVKEIRAHIRSNRNIQIDKVAFEKRTQQQGESFDDYLVTIRKLARNAEICDKCLEDRLLTKIMSGLVDQETREELLAKVPAPKLEEAISFARSKEAARRSNMDLNGRVVQQIRGRDRQRSKSPRGSWRESPRRYQHDQSWGKPRRDPTGNVCYFCGKDDCFSRDNHEKCPAFGEQCHQCRGYDHFAETVACQRGYRREFLRSRRRDRSWRGGENGDMSERDQDFTR